jgi:hypothetical protein
MITFSCSCGKKYQLPDRLAGREVRCNQCGNALIIPNPEPAESENTAALAQTPAQTPTPASAAVAAPQHKTNHWGKIPLPNGEKNEHSPIVSGWATGPYQKGSSCILTIVLVLLGAGGAFVGGFLAGSFVHNFNSSQLADHSESEEPDTSDTAEDVAKDTAEKETSDVSTTYTAADWKIDENSPELFTAQTADGGQIRISLDQNPISAGEKTPTVLDDIADVLGSDGNSKTNNPSKESPKHSQSHSQTHNQTLRIHSESGTEFRLIFPAQGFVDFDAGKFQEIHFSLYIPDKANDGFKPAKTEGIGKTRILSNFSLRFVTESGFIEFVPENQEQFIAILDHAKSDWVPVRIPFSGNEIWKRVEHGLFGSRTYVRRIEFYAQPAGNGATLWIDNLKITE